MVSILKFHNFFLLYFFGFFGVIFRLFLSLIQRDRKSLVAFSSVRHISLAFTGLVFLSNFTQGGILIMGLSHGFLRSLYFWFVGEIFYSVGTRILFFFNSLFLNSLNFIIMFSLILLYSSGAPLSLGYFYEYIFFLFLVLNFFFFVFFMIYFFYDLYLVIYILRLSFLGLKKINVFFSFSLVFIISFLFLVLNFLLILS